MMFLASLMRTLLNSSFLNIFPMIHTSHFLSRVFDIFHNLIIIFRAFDNRKIEVLINLKETDY